MKIRCFTALCFSPDALDAVAGYIGDLKHAIPYDAATIKWEKKENIHLTLNFFGEIEENILQTVIEETKKKIIPNGEPIKLTLSGIGVFPNEHHPKIIWLGCAEKSGRLENMQTLLNDIALRIGDGQINIESRRFTPHVTVARVKSLNSAFLLANVLEKYIQNRSFSIDEDISCLSFMKSVLTPGGSLYTIVENIPL